MTGFKRIQLFEFEDFNWFPSWLRVCMTNLIVILQKMLGVSEVLAGLITKISREKNISQIVDLGSGAGGAMPEVLSILHKDQGLSNMQLKMTDLYPDKEIVAKFNKNIEGLSYHPHAVDATDIATAPAGLKTMVNSFHHMKPENARKILESSKENKQPLLIYEMGKNKLPLILWWLLLPLSLIILMVMVLFMTPFVKPLTWKQVIFTYIIPIIPICYAWDGQASLPRMYTMNDLDILLKDLQDENYRWEKGNALKTNNKKLGTYLIGLPID